MSKAEFGKYYIDYMKKKKLDLLFSRANRVLHYQIGKCDRLYNLGGITKKGHILVDRDTINMTLFSLIKDSTPFLCGRFGSVEARYLAAMEARNLGVIKAIPEKYTSALYNNAGFFSIANEGEGEQFYHIMMKAIEDVNIMGYWGDGMQEYLIDKYSRKDLMLTKLVNIHPYDYQGTAWTAALENKRVVIVHPFKETIEKQYQNREKIWDRKDILPKYDLRVVKAVQTIAGTKDSRFESWFDALEYMYEEIMSEEFDIALIGCGAYGLPLASKVKIAGKQAIHLGGVLQALFGIKGGRFDTYDEFRNGYYNEWWVRPSEEERPENFKKIENGCYW